MRESQRQSGFKVSKKKKKALSTTSNAPKKSSNVEIKVGIAAQTDGVVKARRGKTHVNVITVSSSATKEGITQKAIEKHRSFDQTFDETVTWALLYPDFQEIQWIPGTRQPFILSYYKQAIGKDYKRLTFF